MKKLIYFWCENLRSFEDTEFNFSSKYKIHFDKNTETLTIDKGDKNYIDNFYGDNIELNAIVGNNGAGKSSLLKELFHFGNKGDDIGHFNILVFECLETKKFIVCYYDCCPSESERCVHWSEKSLDETVLLEIPYATFMDDLGEFYRKDWESGHIAQGFKIPFFYITEVLDQEMYNSDVGNYSIGGRIAYAGSGQESMDVVYSFFYDQFEKQMNFISDKVYNKDKKIEIPFPLNESVSVSSLLNIYELEKDKEELVSYLTGVEKLKESDHRVYARRDRDNVFVLLLLHILISELQDFCQSKDKVNSFFDKYTYDKGKGKENIYKRLGTILDDIAKCEDFKGFSLKLKEYYSFLGILEQSKDKIKHFNLNLLGEAYISLPFKADGNGMSLKTFYDEYKKLVKNNYFLYFDWGLSSGETAMLDLYSMFYQIYKSVLRDNENMKKKKEENLKCNDIVLLIDEADAYFHPQWQKNYVNDTLNVAKQIFEGFDVQIILSTHSPIMLSDIPKQNVLYLKKEKDAGTKVVPREERQETFGANIFSLFKDTFFLEGSGIGSFAEKRLTELIAEIHDEKNYKNNEKIRDIERHIGMIGDPFIRKKFESEFEICKQKYMSLIERKERLLKELAQIEQKLKEESQ